MITCLIRNQVEILKADIDINNFTNKIMTTYEKLKISLLVILLFGSLYIFYNYSQNGRFMIHTSSPIILDTQSGDIYFIGKKEKLEIKNFQLAN